MNKEELLKALEELSKAKTDNPISAMNSINVDDFMSAVDRLNKVPTYDELLKENKKQKEIIDKAVLELVNIDGNLSNSQLSDRICNLIDILKEVQE